jgi:hypothetical protein
MGDAILPTLEATVGSIVHLDMDCEKGLAALPPLMDRNRWEDDSSDDDSEFAPYLGRRRALE